MTHDVRVRRSRARVRWLALCAAAGACIVSQFATAAPPSATGQAAAVPLTGGQINLRSQGVIAGTAPMVITTANTTESIIFATPTNGVCVQIDNPQQMDYASEGVQLQVVVGNVDAADGVFLTIPLVAGVGNDNLAACDDPNSPPVANAGPDQTVPDTDGLNGETVVLDASGSFDSDGTIVSYIWMNASSDQMLGITTVPTLTTTLPDGVHVISLTVVDNSGDPNSEAATDEVTITVQAAAAPTANAGPDQTLEDTDGLPGELVTLTGTATPGSGTIVRYEWFDAGEQSLGEGPTLTVRLDDGTHEITLLVEDSNQLVAFDSVTISVGVPAPRGSLANLSGLSSNQRSIATAIDNLCQRLTEAQAESDLLERCNGLIFGTDEAGQREALDQLGAEDLSALQTQTLFFASSQSSGVMERLMALRGGARGMSLGNLQLNLDGKPVPLMRLAMLGELVGAMLGANADSDTANGADEPGSLLGDRLGLWLRGSYSELDKKHATASHNFQSKQTSFTLGADYRFTPNFVAGLSAGYNDSSLDYRGGSRGGLDTSGWTASLYGSAYAVGNFYIDGVVSFGKSDYDSTRRITYLEGTTLIDRTAVGSTDGTTTSGALSMGYDFQLGALTLSPTASYLYTEADIDSMTESGASGLDLIVDERRFSASTATLGLRAVYALSFRWGVLLPHFRGEFVRELDADADVFGVRFANDPFASSADPTPPIVVVTDNPDRSYWRFTVGSSAQFKYGVSAYAEYQRLQSFQYVSFDDFTVGLRLQRSF